VVILHLEWPKILLMSVSRSPRSKSFPDWRNGDDYDLTEKLRWPADGVCFDIQYNDFWMEAWGERPANLNDAFRVARREIEKAPALIPVYSHRYIPDDPNLAGNPVFSVYQTDINYYGVDLASYFTAEFRMPRPSWAANEERYIRFWGDLAE
jgi:hypothetical protein